MRMVEEYQREADPIGRGLGTFDQASLGFAYSCGHSFPWIGGCYVLRRRRLYPDVSEWTFCGSADIDAATVKNSTGFPHEANMAYQYAAAVAFGNAQASEFCEPIRVDFDGSVALITPPMPMFPLNVQAKPIAGGKFLVTWSYDPYGHGAWPTDFQVFAGATVGTIDYGTPLTDSVTGLSVAKVYGPQRRFEFTTAAFSHGTTKVFGVRARNSGGVSEKNTRTSSPVIAVVNATAAASSISQAVQGRQR